MCYLKTKEYKFLVISWGKDYSDPFYFKAFKHKGSNFFHRFTKVIDFTFKGRRLVLEF